MESNSQPEVNGESDVNDHEVNGSPDSPVEINGGPDVNYARRNEINTEMKSPPPKQSTLLVSTL